MYNAKLEIQRHHYQGNFIGHISTTPFTNQRSMNDNMKKHFYAFVIALTRQNASSYIYMKLHIGYGISKRNFLCGNKSGLQDKAYSSLYKHSYKIPHSVEFHIKYEMC